jgi:hypothetical protein
MRNVSFITMLLLTISLSYAQSPHGAKFNLDCQLCHNSENWKIDLSKVKFDHSKTGFELIGEHKNVLCKSCHSSLEFSSLKSKVNCVDCHKDIHENTVGLFCAKCHTSNTWVVENINDIHRMSRFPLLGNHLKADCNQCHTSASHLKFNPLGIRCFDCHSADYFAAKNPDHVTAGFSKDCEQCHNVSSTQWSATGNVSHAFFPLVDGHAISNCFACHKQNTYAGLTQECFSCHQSNYLSVKSPDHVKLNFSKDCKECHTLNPGWKPANFTNHDAIYPLLGAHNTIRTQCEQCHSNGYSNTPTECVGCHQTNYNNAPKHTAQNYPLDCKQCHGNTDWKTITFNHSSTTFLLTGAHLTVTCQSCHINKLAGIASDCYSCHQTNFNSAANHVAQNFPHDCTLCHSTNSWQGSSFDHAKTVFPLTGAHTTVACALCHATQYAGTPTDCISCHQSKFSAAPNHAAQNYPQDCKPCHNTTDWKIMTFNHATTTFPLSGAHVTVNCQLCHVTKLAGIASDCYSCHQTNFNSAANHVAQNFPHDCTLCHSTNSWQGSSFDHAKTVFPLTGAHTTVACALCHATQYAGTPTDCISCHQSKFSAAPNHAAQNYPQDCKPCHNTTDWKIMTFNHATTTFPLSGAHITVNCQLCHVTKLAGIASDCYSCHQTNFNSAPNHTTQNYPHDCTLCHSTTNWTSSTFNHATTTFPLSGAHTTVACNTCHKNNYTGGLATDCYSCHQTDFTGTANPNHVTSSFPHDCTLCHSTTNWTSSTFNHATTSFPLSGAHTTVACNTCHKNNYTGGLATDCYSCHQTDFTGTANPNHVTSSFPHDCTLCHSTTNWTSSTFNHATTSFPLSGAHTTVACNTCHKNNYTGGLATDCYSCHQTDFTGTANPNHVTSSFPHDCTVCHSTTNWTSSTFNHATTTFPLTGAHTSVACNTCHNNNYTGSLPTACYGCHLADFNGTTNPNHATAKFPTDCTQCHTTANWTSTTYNHDGQYFPIYSGNHKGRWTLCSDCHQNASNFLIHSCNFSCHKNDHHQNQDCYTCHPTGRAD